MPVFFAVGYLLSIIAYCAAWLYAIIVPQVRLFHEMDSSTLTIVGAASFGASALLGLAAFWRPAARGRKAAVIGLALNGASMFVWLLILASRSASPAPGVLLAASGPLLLHFLLRRRPAGLLAHATAWSILLYMGALLLNSPLFFGCLIASCLLAACRIVSNRGNATGGTAELMIAVGLMALSAGLSASGLRGSHPIYSSKAIIIPLENWAGSLQVELDYYAVWIEYPKANLSKEQRQWFSERHSGERFYRCKGAELMPLVIADDGRRFDREPNITVVSDQGDWLGEELDTYLIGNGQHSRLYLRDTEKLARIGARIVVDVPNLQRIKRLRR